VSHPSFFFSFLPSNLIALSPSYFFHIVTFTKECETSLDRRGGNFFVLLHPESFALGVTIQQHNNKNYEKST